MTIRYLPNLITEIEFTINFKLYKNLNGPKNHNFGKIYAEEKFLILFLFEVDVRCKWKKRLCLGYPNKI